MACKVQIEYEDGEKIFEGPFQTKQASEEWIAKRTVLFRDNNARATIVAWSPERCQAWNYECGQCELANGHGGKHLAGYLLWGSDKPAPQPGPEKEQP